MKGKVRFGVQKKLFLAMVFMTVMDYFIAVSVGIWNQSTTLWDLFQTNQVTFSNVLSHTAKGAVETFNEHLLNEQVEILVKQQGAKYLTYALVQDFRGTVWAFQAGDAAREAVKDAGAQAGAAQAGPLETTRDLVGATLEDAATKKALSVTEPGQQLFQHVLYKGEMVTDISTSIFAKSAVGEGKWGVVRLGITDRFIKEKLREVILKFTSILILFIAISGFLAVFISTRISKPVMKLVAVFREMARAGGDLTKRVEVGTRDELADLAEATNEMRSGIAGIVRQVQDVSRQLGKTSQELSDVSETATASTEQVAASMGTVAKGTEAEKEGVQKVFAVVKEMSGVVNLAIQTAESNKRLADETLNTITLIEDSIEEPTAKKAVLRIKEAVQKSAHEIGLVGTVTRELEKGNKVIVDNMEQILKVSFGNASEAETVSATAEEQSATIQQVTATASSLRESGKALAELVGKFKV